MEELREQEQSYMLHSFQGNNRALHKPLLQFVSVNKSGPGSRDSPNATFCTVF